MMADTRVAFDDADAYDRYMGRWSRAIGEKFLAWLDPPENRSWLDVGCGSGAFTGLILRHAAPGTITGIDPSPQQVEHAKRTVAAPQADFRAGTADDLPFETGAFDVVVSALVIHFVEDRPKAFREMLRVTRPGGIVAGYTWRRSPTIIDAPYGPLARAVLQLTGVPVAAVPTTTGFSRVTTFGIDTNYLDVYGLRVVAGRPFDALDATASNKPIVVDQSFARRFLNDQFAVGRRIRYAGTPDGQPSPWYEIVGVAENLQRNPVDPDAVSPTILFQSPRSRRRVSVFRCAFGVRRRPGWMKASPGECTRSSRPSILGGG